MATDEIQQIVANVAPGLPKGDHINRIALFGSRLHGSAGVQSDIDLLIEFSGTVTFFDMAAMKRMLEAELGQSVDLVTPRSLSKYFRDDVLAEAQTLYERT